LSCLPQDFPDRIKFVSRFLATSGTRLSVEATGLFLPVAEQKSRLLRSIVNRGDPVEDNLKALIFLMPYYLNHVVSNKSSVERVEETNVCTNTTSKLIDVFRLPVKPLPHSIDSLADTPSISTEVPIFVYYSL
jgi:hypothetical protein